MHNGKVESAQYGKKMKPVGRTPAIALVNPKYPHNVGAAVRAASCFGFDQVWFSGDRVSMENTKKNRIPREERMKGYSEVELRQYERFFDTFPKGTTPVAIEVRAHSQNLAEYIHPPNPLYVFGPEDGGLNRAVTRRCHDFVIIPTRHCVNLGAAIYLVMYDRALKLWREGIEPLPELCEQRGFTEAPDDLVFTPDRKVK